MNPTTDPSLRSFIHVPPESHFPIQNLPYGVFSTPGVRDGNHPPTAAKPEQPRIGVRIGEFVLDLRVIEHCGFFREVFGDEHVLCKWSLNKFMAAGPQAWAAVRRIISGLLRHDEPTLRDDAKLRDEALVPFERVRMHLPCEIGDYTDFYSSKEHATNVGIMMRGPQNALQPNWVWLPVAYHGRASSIVVSGTDLRRPRGQTKADDARAPSFGPSRLVDFELEMGLLVGPGNELGRPIPVDEAERHIFGLVLVNDWSARDIQKWEYVPLGPFGSKNFGTTISPWVVTLEALVPFRCEGPAQTPQPLAYLRPRAPSQPRPPARGLQSDGAERRAHDVERPVRDAGGESGESRCVGAPEREQRESGSGISKAQASDPGMGTTFDIPLEVGLQSAAMDRPQVIARSNFRYLYWSMAQQIAHHTVTGCNLRPGDLLASGTISGPTPDSGGSLLELTWRGERPIQLADGSIRRFLKDGDRVTMTGWCQGEGYRIGFGECTGRILPAIESA